MSRTLELPAEIGKTVYNIDLIEYPMQVIGYRVGRMSGEDEEDFEEEFEDADELYVQYECPYMSVSSPISEFGKSIFLTRHEAEQALAELEEENEYRRI